MKEFELKYTNNLISIQTEHKTEILNLTNKYNKEISGLQKEISDLKERLGTQDDEAMFILGRQTMNFIDLCGAHDCYLLDAGSDDDKHRLAIALGFKPDGDGNWYMDLRGFFEDPCKHGK